MSRSAPSKIVLIAGPTASGKSSLALALAERIGGAIINADSMQVYRELHIITARPSEADEARAPHFLYGHVRALEAYSAGRFVADAASAIDDSRRRGLVPIIVGGTGLYFQALLEGLSPIPDTDATVRAHWRRECARLGAPALHATLSVRDSEMAARLAPGDAQRIVRALEVLDTTGRSLADWQREKPHPVIAAADAVCLRLSADRSVLQRRADARLDWMVANGALDEVAALAALDLDEDLPAMRAIGVRPLMSAALGKSSLEEALEAAKTETRRYIKRQQTWLTSKMIAWNVVFAKDMESSVASAIAFIDC